MKLLEQRLVEDPTECGRCPPQPPSASTVSTKVEYPRLLGRVLDIQSSHVWCQSGGKVHISLVWRDHFGPGLALWKRNDAKLEEFV